MLSCSDAYIGLCFYLRHVWCVLIYFLNTWQHRPTSGQNNIILLLNNHFWGLKCSPLFKRYSYWLRIRYWASVWWLRTIATGFGFVLNSFLPVQTWRRTPRCLWEHSPCPGSSKAWSKTSSRCCSRPDSLKAWRQERVHKDQKTKDQLIHKVVLQSNCWTLFLNLYLGHGWGQRLWFIEFLKPTVRFWGGAALTLKRWTNTCTMKYYNTVGHSQSQMYNTNVQRSVLFKLGEHVGHHHAALDGFLRGVVVFEQSEHVPAVLHRQASDQLLHHLTHTGKHKHDLLDTHTGIILFK